MKHAKKNNTQNILMIAGAVASLLALYFYSRKPATTEPAAQALPEVQGYGAGGAPSGSFVPAPQAAVPPTVGEQVRGPNQTPQPDDGPQHNGFGPQPGTGKPTPDGPQRNGFTRGTPYPTYVPLPPPVKQPYPTYVRHPVVL